VPQDRKSFASETDFLVFTPQLLILRIEPERRKDTYFRSHALPNSTNCKPITAQLYESFMTSREPALIVPVKRRKARNETRSKFFREGWDETSC
jgi:hypothetical protein